MELKALEEEKERQRIEADNAKKKKVVKKKDDEDYK